MRLAAFVSTEVEPEDPCHQVELGDGDEAPVEPADDQQCRRE